MSSCAEFSWLSALSLLELEPAMPKRLDDCESGSLYSSFPSSTEDDTSKMRR